MAVLAGDQFRSRYLHDLNDSTPARTPALFFFGLHVDPDTPRSGRSLQDRP
ncbi:MAG: hypothetical protein GY895_12955 [Phycisphaera sp.]|nr:hypothetical protein [Phycisphaera sp.]